MYSYCRPPAPSVTRTCISRDGRSLTCGHPRAYCLFFYPQLADLAVLSMTTSPCRTRCWRKFGLPWQ